MISNCKQCRHEFRVTKYRRVYCSVKCHRSYTHKIDKAKLALFAFQGLEGKDIAAAFGCSPPRVTRALRSYGLYEQWLEQRYA